MSQKTIGLTTTGEIFQPVRLYYTTSNCKKVAKRLSHLRCIQYDALKKRSVWLYNEEAKDLDFKINFHSIPEDISPVVIGSFVWKGADTLIMDLRSYERALHAVQFFDRYIPRSLAKVTHGASVNRIFGISESAVSNFDVFFENNDKLVTHDPEAMLDRIRKASLSNNGVPNFQGIVSFLNNEMEKFFEFEKFPIHFYQEGISSLKTTFVSNRVIAIERWKGNANYSSKDLFEQMCGGPLLLPPELARQA